MLLEQFNETKDIIKDFNPKYRKTLFSRKNSDTDFVV